MTSFLTTLFRILPCVFYLFFSTNSTEGTCRRRAPVLTWILTNKTLNMTAQLPGFTEGSSSTPRNSPLAHIPTQWPGQNFPRKAGIYLLLPQRKCVRQWKSKREAEKGYSSIYQSSVWEFTFYYQLISRTKGKLNKQSQGDHQIFKTL